MMTNLPNPFEFSEADTCREIIEFDFNITGIEQKIDHSPTPDELWHRQK